MLVKQFHYISKEESQMVLESINTHKVIVQCWMQGLQFQKRAALNVKILILKIEILPFNQQKKREKNTCEQFQYQTGFIINR
jgi:hypothetical protein